MAWTDWAKIIKHQTKPSSDTTCTNRAQVNLRGKSIPTNSLLLFSAVICIARWGCEGEVAVRQ